MAVHDAVGHVLAAVGLHLALATVFPAAVTQFSRKKRPLQRETIRILLQRAGYGSSLQRQVKISRNYAAADNTNMRVSS